MDPFTHRGHKYSTYKPPSSQFISGTMFYLDQLISHFWELITSESHVFGSVIPAQAATSARPAFELWRDLDGLSEAIIRVDQRKLHYRMYYDDMRWNELKQTATYIYWIIRYKPLYLYEHPLAASVLKAQLPGYQKPFPNNKINEEFCFYLVLLLLSSFNKELSPEAQYMLRYDLCHRNVSYDSLATILTAAS